MKKIYNNLTVENLIKTETFKKLTIKQKEELLKKSQWFNQFNKNQKSEILDGVNKGLDVSIYAKPEFNEFQMM